MFQQFDKLALDHPQARTVWLGLLARAPETLLNSGLSGHMPDQVHYLRRPETGLMMLQARTGGQGERFNLGEITVTRCAVRIDDAPEHATVGIAHITGRSHRRAQLAAVADALLQNPATHPALSRQLLDPVRDYLQRRRDQQWQRSQTTRVDFLTMTRESDNGEGEDAA